MMGAPMSPSDSHSRLLLASALLWAAPCAALLDSGIAGMFCGWRPRGVIESSLLLFFGAWAALAITLGHGPSRRRIAGLWRELLLLACITMAGWPLLEIAAGRAEKAMHPHPPFHTRGANIHNVFTPDPAYLPGIHGPSHFTTGPSGLRAAAPPAPGQVHVLCVGGSTTECVYLDDTETWAALLPHYLDPALAANVWVGNAGISGFDTQDHLRFVKESPLLEDAAALVVQPGINDLWRFLAREVDTMDYTRFTEGSNQNLVPAPAVYRPWWSRSRLIQLYHTWRQLPPPPEQREGIGGQEYEIRREKRRVATLTGSLPPLAQGLEAYRARIGEIIAACRARGVPVLFTSQAVLWRADLPPEIAARCWFGWLPDGRYLTLAALRDAMDQYNAALLDTCAKAGVTCVDLSELNGNTEWFYDDCHFTESGARHVAQRVGPLLSALLQP